MEVEDYSLSSSLPLSFVSCCGEKLKISYLDHALVFQCLKYLTHQYFLSIDFAGMNLNISKKLFTGFHL